MRKSERSTFAAERLVKTVCGCNRLAKINCPVGNTAACRRLDSRLIRMPAGRETRLARRWDRLNGPRTSEFQFPGRCAANPECLWPVAAFAVFPAALGRQILGKPYLLVSTP